MIYCEHMMKRYLYTFMFVLVLIVAVSASFFIFHIREKDARAIQANNVYGWAWSENFGWISLNCYNYYGDNLVDRCASSTDSACDGDSCVDYGVNIDPQTQALEGYGWSSNHGWIDFSPQGPYPGSPNASSFLDQDGRIVGWARVINLGDDGWIRFDSFLCNSGQGQCFGVAGVGPYILDNQPLDGQSSMCYNCNKYIRSCTGGSDVGKACTTDDDCSDGGVCNGDFIVDENGELMCELCMSQHIPDYCVDTGFPVCENEDKSPSGAFCTFDPTVPKSDAFLCTDCVKYTDGSGSIVSCGQCPRCYVHGVGIDYESNRLVGWGWNSFGNGVGWIHFNPTASHIVGPWLETQLGNVYSQQDLGSPFTYEPPSTKYSASYQIQAGGTITNFSTKSGDTFVQEQFQELDFPDVNQLYSNALGRIDFSGLEIGQYGETEEITSPTFIDSTLGGKVYIHQGDMVISQADYPNGVTFNVGTVAIPNGSGTVIVEGDLYIETDIRYDNNLPITRLSYLPSIAWIVKGDVNISPNVRSLAGAYIVLGDGTVCPSLTQLSNGCGRFNTGVSDTQFFDVNGLVMAKQFNLQRNVYSPDRGAEQFVYDGRAVANPPPGLGDITQVLPLWQGVAP